MELLEFPHSHYCEKARWALDHKGIPFQATAIMPGYHVRTVRKIAPKTSVPVLIDGEKVVQGSSEIIDYLEQKHPNDSLTPKDTEQHNACLEIERNADKRLGIPLRQILYSGLLPHTRFIRHCFTHPMPGHKQLIFTMLYPLLRRKIYGVYVKSDAEVEQAKAQFEIEMAKTEKKLSQRRYLVGEQFSRADLSVASMLSLLVMPDEHPFPWRAIPIPDPQTQAFYDAYQDHPVCEWVREVYREHR